ncbi:acyltransferase domain-containing protein, partial [Solemya velum gill symbiont]
DPENHLNLTQYSQPALFFVNALSFLKLQQDGVKTADFFAGHSLGEYNALFAAGCFDIETGIQLVRKRGEIMSRAPKGGMAAVLGLSLDEIATLIRQSGLNNIDIANINMPTQTVVSGDKTEILAFAEYVEQKPGARYIPLRVSGAFHSRLMKQAAVEFDEFLQAFSFHSPRTPVLANITAQSYSSAPEEIRNTLVTQLSSSVYWLDIMTNLFTDYSVEYIREVGPGQTLTRMWTEHVKTLPKGDRTVQHQVNRDTSAPATVFMYPGQGSHYYHMGKELYADDQAFKRAFDQCDEIIADLAGFSLAHIVYQQNNPFQDFNETRATHPACFAFNYAMSKTLEARGITADYYLGYSLGEYNCLVSTDILDLESALKLVFEQGELFQQLTSPAGMLAIFAPLKLLEQLLTRISGLTLAAVNHDTQFILTGSEHHLNDCEDFLKTERILFQRLPVSRGFHSTFIDATKQNFLALAETLRFSSASRPYYSCATTSTLSEIDPIRLWSIAREPVQFAQTIRMIESEIAQPTYIDLGASGSLANVLPHLIADKHRALFTVNRFGNNLKTMAQMSGKFDSIRSCAA